MRRTQRRNRTRCIGERQTSPKNVRCTPDAAGLLDNLRDELAELDELLCPKQEKRIGEVLLFLQEKNIVAFDERYTELIQIYADTTEPLAELAHDNAALRFTQCDAPELWGYRKYVEDQSPFATQQGIKGAEFDKVLVVIDDQEASFNTFSYGKYFGVTQLSAADQRNLDAKKDSVIDRTRRLFYVCCSRSVSDLAVIIFSENTKRMHKAIISKVFSRTTASMFTTKSAHMSS